MKPDKSAGITTVLRDARLVLADRLIERGWLRIEGSTIASLGAGALPPSDATAATTSAADEVELGGCTVIPGLVDLHGHGGGGRRFEEGTLGAAEAVVRLHRAHGTTTQLASVGTGTPAEMLAATAALAQATRAGLIGGIHLEGPFLNPLRRGAHDPAKLRPPDRGLLGELLAAGGGAVRVMTVAPELPGGTELVEVIAAAGAIPAMGHTDASFQEAVTAIRAGVRLATHLFNGMRPVHHREPGVAAAALLDEAVVVELINDGYHLADATAQMARRLAGAGRTAFITDAMAAAGVGDGVYRLSEREVRVEGGRSVLADGSSLAGSCLTMDRAFARAVRRLGLSLVDAAQAAASVPARLLGLDDRGSLAPAKRADLVVLDQDLEVLAVMIQGHWIAGTVPGRTGLSRAEDEDPLGAGATGSGSIGGRKDYG